MLSCAAGAHARQGGGDAGPTASRARRVPTSGGTVIQRPGGFEPKPLAGRVGPGISRHPFGERQ